MREVFKPVPGESADPGRVFYTITTADTGKSSIETTIGTISLAGWFGRIQEGDVGKRLYRLPAGDVWVWQCENDAQRYARQCREIDREITAATGRPPRH